MGDPELAVIMQRLNPPAPMEAIVETDILATVVNHLRLDGARVVLLACGHKTITANAKRARCAECHTMIMNGEDYEAFRNRNNRADHTEP